MASYGARWLVLALAAAVCCGAAEVDVSSADQVQELLAAQQRAKDGVVHLDPSNFGRLVTGKQRAFSLFVFLTAEHLMDKPGLGLAEMRREFGYLAKAYRAQLGRGEVEQPGSLFFADIEFKESQELFQRLQIASLPGVFILAGSVSAERERLKIREADTLKPDSYDKFPWTADEFDAFLTERLGVTVGKVERPSLLKSPFFPVLALAGLSGGAYAGIQIYYSPIVKNLWIWIAGALTIYWFSVSGGMYNIIRGMPLYVLTQQGPQYFMPPGQGQLGGEGFLGGTGYLLVGLSVSGLTLLPSLAPRLRMDRRKVRYAAFALVALGAWSFMKVVAMYRWKTGYRWRTYFGGWRA